MSRPKGSKNKPKEDKETGLVSGLSIAASIAQSLSKFAKAEPPFDKKSPTIHLEDMEGEFEVDPNKKVEFRVPAKEDFNDIANGRDEISYPKDWSTLSKVDKLQWLTAQKAKR